MYQSFFYKAFSGEIIPVSFTGDTASGDFGQITRTEFLTDEATFQIISMDITGELRITSKPDAGSYLLSYCMQGSFLFQGNTRQQVPVGQKQYVLSQDVTPLQFICKTDERFHDRADDRFHDRADDRFHDRADDRFHDREPAEKKRFVFFIMTLSVDAHMGTCTTTPSTSTIDFQKEFSDILRELGNTCPDPFALNTHAHLLLLGALDQTRQIGPFQRKTNNAEKRKIFLLAESMIMRMDENWDLKKLAGSQKLNPVRLKVIFKKHIGLPPTAFKISVRMKKAAQLLEETRLNIQEISVQVGYWNPAQFSTLFKRKMGCSPSKYRKDGFTAPGPAPLRGELFRNDDEKPL